MKYKIVRPDAKGRITLGRVAEGVSSYIVTEADQHRLILDPQVEIPANEKWLFENATALNQVKKGLKDSAVGKVKRKGSFIKYMDDKEE